MPQPGKVSLKDRTLGTMKHLAERELVGVLERNADSTAKTAKEAWVAVEPQSDAGGLADLYSFTDSALPAKPLSLGHAN